MKHDKYFPVMTGKPVAGEPWPLDETERRRKANMHQPIGNHPTTSEVNKDGAREDIKQALEYVYNSGGCTQMVFDVDHEPIGPWLRDDIRKFVTMTNGVMKLNDAGLRMVAK